MKNYQRFLLSLLLLCLPSTGSLEVHLTKIQFSRLHFYPGNFYVETHDVRETGYQFDCSKNCVRQIWCNLFCIEDTFCHMTEIVVAANYTEKNQTDMLSCHTKVPKSVPVSEIYGSAPSSNDTSLSSANPMSVLDPIIHLSEESCYSSNTTDFPYLVFDLGQSIEVAALLFKVPKNFSSYLIVKGSNYRESRPGVFTRFQLIGRTTVHFDQIYGFRDIYFELTVVKPLRYISFQRIQKNTEIKLCSVHVIQKL